MPPSMSATRYNPSAVTSPTVPQTTRALPRMRLIDHRANAQRLAALLQTLPGGREAGWWVATLALALGGWVAQTLVTFNPSRGTAPFGHLLQSSHELIYLVVGLACGYAFRIASPDGRRRLAYTVLWVSLGLLAWVFFYGFTTNGAQRWIRIGGFSFQPLELAKLGVIVSGAAYFAPAIKPTAEAFATQTYRVAIGWITIFGFVVLQPNISGAIILAALMMGMAWAGGIPRRLLMIVGILGVLVFGIYIARDPERSQRMQAMHAGAAASHDLRAENYQKDQAAFAIAQGGWLGTGAGHSTVKRTLPASESDFIFAILVEEYGILGGLAVILAMAGIFVAVLHLSAACPDRFLQFIGLGIALHWGFQALVNLQVNLGGVTTGVPLPFFSKAGSAALVLGIELALVALIAATVDRKPAALIFKTIERGGQPASPV